MGARKQKDRLADKDRKFCAVLYPDAEDYDCEVDYLLKMFLEI